MPPCSAASRSPPAPTSTRTRRRAAPRSSACARWTVDALIADPDIDLVLNLTIPAAHFDISMQALSAGKHVFTEKPLAVKAEAGRAARGHGRVARPCAGIGPRHVPRRGRTAGAAPDGGRRHRHAGHRNRLHDGARHGALAPRSELLLPGRGRPGHGHGALLSDDDGQPPGAGAPRPGRRHQRPGGAADHRRGTEERDAVQGRHADQRPVAAGVRLRGDGDIRRIVGRLPAFQLPDRTAWHQGIPALARPRQFRRRRRRLRHGAAPGRKPTPPPCPTAR